MLTYDEVIKNEAIRIYIQRADESLRTLGFTEHSFAHVMHVAETAGYILKSHHSLHKGNCHSFHLCKYHACCIRQHSNCKEQNRKSYHNL